MNTNSGTNPVIKRSRTARFAAAAGLVAVSVAGAAWTESAPAAMAGDRLIAADRPLAVVENDLPRNSILRQIRPVNDAYLAGMRGRYVQGNRITHFGLTMVSRLQDGGTAMQGQMQMNADLSGGQPRVQIQSQASVSGDQATGNAAIGGGIASDRDFRGTFQTVQVAGDNNTGYNNFSVDMVDSSAFRAQPRLATDGSTRVVSTATGVGIDLQTPSGSRVRQSITPGRGLEQQIRLTGDHQMADNLTSLRVGLSRTSGMSATAGLGAAVRSIQDLAR